MQPQPLQIITTGDSETDLFSLNSKNLASIIDKIPDGTKVAVVSVVGAFRTGKSFLLNFFLRYLRANLNKDDFSIDWMISEGEELAEGNMNEGWDIVDKGDAINTPPKESTAEGISSSDKSEEKKSPQLTKQQSSFAWRGGKERQTTGIWMWSEPFIRQTHASEDDLAILLMDTQGMFDNETTVTLTAQIFGLSTLVSSFQIYNVDKRIQEDNLQHLALFSEYGRMALLPHEEKTDKEEGGDETKLPTEIGDAKNLTTKNKDENEDLDLKLPEKKPFQNLQFLVRDWQNFEYDGGELPIEEADIEYFRPRKVATPVDSTKKENASSSSNKDKMTEDGDKESDQPVSTAKTDLDEELNSHADVTTASSALPPPPPTVFQGLRNEMKEYLSEVLRTRGLSDLQSTREQISRCFESIDCFMLPHPGFAVTKKNYDGAIGKIEPFFKSLINRYVRSIFDKELRAKTVNGRQLTGKELQIYMEVYAKMFQTGEKTFPKAMTMLDATAEANNRSAFDMAMRHYKTNMELLAGVDKQFVKLDRLNGQHELFFAQAFEIFDEIATMGPVGTISAMREKLNEDIDESKQHFFETNALRNPFKDLELYIIPIMVAIVAWFLAVVVNATCSHDVCEAAEDGLVNVYLFVTFAILVTLWKQIRGAYQYMRELLPILLQGGSATDALAAVAAVKASQQKTKASSATSTASSSSSISEPSSISS